MSNDPPAHSFRLIPLVEAAEVAADRGFGLAAVPAPEDGRRGRVYVRRDLDVRSFGVNAFYQADAGAVIVGEHDELGPGGSGHEELYVVVRGSCTFTIEGETVDAPYGTALFVPEPATTRAATADEDGTLVLVVGGRPGEPYASGAGEMLASASFFRHYREGDDEAALDACRQALAAHPGNPLVLYNLACVAARLGHVDEALDALGETLEASPDYRKLAVADDDLAPLRNEPRFRALAGDAA
jgi:tetratricopeptide (TPR) repeat protein